MRDDSDKLLFLLSTRAGEFESHACAHIHTCVHAHNYVNSNTHTHSLSLAPSHLSFFRSLSRALSLSPFPLPSLFPPFSLTGTHIRTHTRIVRAHTLYTPHCTRNFAGGLGLNLQKANWVVLFDSDWNPQADIQVHLCCVVCACTCVYVCACVFVCVSVRVCALIIDHIGIHRKTNPTMIQCICLFLMQ